MLCCYLNLEYSYPSFVASLLDIALFKRKQIKISAQYISVVTIASHLEAISTLTLEYFIRLNQTNEQNELIHESLQEEIQLYK
ncbi:unnamed protein product [Rotaria sordida]|uniref:Uncharacterized protein n=2 Tax=Rotaria sordida TaxID=392033 RepID=A0A818TCL6_9BILA|nr:unnamed protein product [Rotaria sordida]CAF3680014.1 unnamed protein product [Rotaria sordida]